MNKHNMWKLYRGDDIYCFQSKDPRVKRKMARRKDFSVFNTWSDGTMVYVTSKNTTQSAIRTLARLTGSKVNYLRSEGVYVAETDTIVTFKNGPLNSIKLKQGERNNGSIIK